MTTAHLPATSSTRSDLEPCQLSPATLFEPLVNEWLAWSFVVAPATASLHLYKYQLPLIRSFLEDPGLHEACSQDPELAGGAFMGLAATDVPLVERLLQGSLDALGPNIAFAEALLRLSAELAREAKGERLRGWYERLPTPLRGYVELVYDYHHRPNIRVLEGLLYESPLYRRDLQAFRLSRLTSDASRPFFVNTPRFARPDHPVWQVPFDDPLLDRLFATDVRAQSFGAVREMLSPTQLAGVDLSPFLTTCLSQPRPPYEGLGVRVRYIGHACLLMDWRGGSLMTDPYIPVRPEGQPSTRFSYDNLPDQIDYAVVTHNHQDHFSCESLLRLRHRIRTLIVPRAYGLLYGDISLAVLARRLGFRNVVEMDTLDRLMIDGGEIVAVPFFGEHGDLGHAKTAYVISVANRRILVGADSDCLDVEMYRNVRAALGQIDTVFLGTESVGAPLTWLNGALFPEKPAVAHDQERRQRGCDASRAIEILRTLGTTNYFNYAMGLEPWMGHLLGLTLDPESPQCAEAAKALAWARRSGFTAAEQLNGAREFMLLPE